MRLRCFSMTTKGNCKTFVKRRTSEMASQGRIYLDHNATSPVRPEVAAVVARALELPGNPSSVHAEGRAARASLEEAREHVARLVGARAKNVVFTSGGTEAANMCFPELPAAGQPGAAMLMPRRHGASLRAQWASLPGRPGRARSPSTEPASSISAWLEPASTPWPASAVLVSVQLANNETGVIQPVAEVARSFMRMAALCMRMPSRRSGKIAVDFAGARCSMPDPIRPQVRRAEGRRRACPGLGPARDRRP